MKLLDSLTKIYQIANKSNFLETKFGKSLFRKAYFLYKKQIEDVFYPLIKKQPQIFQNGHILDVGANIGYTTVLFAKVLSPNYKVFAIEPHPQNFEKLLENIKYFNLEDFVVPIQAAIGETTGEITLWENEKSHADHRILTESLNTSLNSSNIKTIKVPILSLDDLVDKYNIQGKLQFVKIDVQGYELPVLAGMKNVLSQNSNLKICLEYSPDMLSEMGFEKHKIFEYFVDYNRYIVLRKGLVKFEQNETITKNLFANGYGDILFSKQPI